MMQMEKLNEPLQRAGQALSHLAVDLGEFIRAILDFAAAAHSMGLLETAKEAEKLAALTESALKEAPPRVRHLALHSKKYRTRRKNINRALKSYSCAK